MTDGFGEDTRPFPSSPPPRRRWTGIALAVSLLLNLFLIGVLVGGRLAWGPVGGFDPASGPGFVPQMMRSLPPEARAVALDVFGDRRAMVRDRLADMRRTHRATYEALTAEPFDPAALTAALADLRSQVDGLQLSVHQALVDVASQLDAEDRRAMAETLRDLAQGQRRNHRPGHRGSHHGP